eukprot:TRINITY_DN106122_c0_g1_i1.p1 TRINITY_DN106122_c0_g1~~TRINITY_DN106122_c0_g1_i1.p1  ORF type:complete len:152 (+),score=14.52 TRINITY_DN106122_c0_g1_i1:65-457(+)
MPGAGGGLVGGEGKNHRPLSSYASGNRYASFQAFGYVRGHPGDGMNNPPTYQMCRQSGHDYAPMRTTLYRSTRSLYEHQAFSGAAGGMGSKSGSLPCLHQSAKLGTLPPQTYSELRANRIMASLPHISPW